MESRTRRWEYGTQKEAREKENTDRKTKTRNQRAKSMRSVRDMYEERNRRWKGENDEGGMQRKGEKKKNYKAGGMAKTMDKGK